MAVSNTFVLNLKFERLWFLYKTEGEPKGVSINSFCISNNIPYTAFYDWFKKKQKKIEPVEVEGIPEELVQASNGEQDVTKEKPKRTTPHKENIMVTIRVREACAYRRKYNASSGSCSHIVKLP